MVPGLGFNSAVKQAEVLNQVTTSLTYEYIFLNIANHGFLRTDVPLYMYGKKFNKNFFILKTYIFFCNYSEEKINFRQKRAAD